MTILRPFAVLFALGLATQSADAQGLLWSLPEDGKWIRYEGKFSQTNFRPENAEGDLKLTWDRHLTIKSVGAAEGEFRGQSQPCRWIEIKVVTGKVNEGIIDPGPGGMVIYKLLIPETAITGSNRDKTSGGAEVFASYVPIVEGFRKIGDEPAAKIESGLFDLFPVVSQLRHYRDMEDGGEQQVQTPVAAVDGKLYKGKLAMETSTLRTTSDAEIYQTADSQMPFGLCKWTAKAVTQEKASTASRAEFKDVTEVVEEMEAREIGDGAETELATE